MTLLENRSPKIPAPREITTKPRLSDQIFRIVVTIGGMTSLVILGLIALFLSLKGISVLRVEQLSFITESKWEVLQDAEGKVAESTFGLGAMLIGTFLSALLQLSLVCQSRFLALYLTFMLVVLQRKFWSLSSISWQPFPRSSLVLGFHSFDGKR